MVAMARMVLIHRFLCRIKDGVVDLSGLRSNR